MKRVCMSILISMIVIISTLANICINSENVYAEEVPRIILDSYEVKEGNFSVGESTKIVLHIANTNSSIDVKNLLLTYESEENLIYSPQGEDNQIYIGNVKANSMVDAEFTVIVSTNTERESVPITFTAAYTNASTKSEVKNEFMIYIPISNIKTSSTINIATSTTVGGNTYVSANFVNNGYNNINELKMSVVGNIKDDSGEEKDILASMNGNTKYIEMGDVNAGNSAYVEDTIVFTEAGQQNVTISFEYIDENGEQHYEIAGEYSVNVMERASNKDGGKINKAGTTLLWFICIAIGIIALAMLVAFMIYKQKRGELSLEILKEYIERIRVRFK